MMPCPRCAQALEQDGAAAGCKACGGVWLEQARLVDMLREMRVEPTVPVFAVRAGADRCACPTCGELMIAVSLEGVDLDRCAAHGVWFDAQELERTLQAAADDDGATVRVGLGRAILRGFGRLLGAIGYLVAGALDHPVMRDPLHRR